MWVAVAAALAACAAGVPSRLGRRGLGRHGRLQAGWSEQTRTIRSAPMREKAVPGRGAIWYAGPELYGLTP